MAFTATKLYQFNEGNKVCIAYDVVADANSGSVATGLNVVDAVIATVQSAATGAQKFKRNLNAAGAAANGTVFISSCTGGDQFTMICYGH